MDVISVLNTIRSNSSALYQERVPQATRSNIDELGGVLMEYTPLMNEFVGALVNRIAFTICSNRRFKNPLAQLKKGNKVFGTDIEEIYTNPVRAEVFDGSATNRLLAQKQPDTKTIYHRMNRKDMYTITISNHRLKKAFTSLGEMEIFINSVITAMYSGDEIDEFLLMKNTLKSAIAEAQPLEREITFTGDEASCKELVKQMKADSLHLTFPSKSYNPYNIANATKIANGDITACETWTPLENQVLIIPAVVDASTDVEVLAKAFNMDKTEFLKRKFVVDELGAGVLGVLCDEAIFKFYDDEYVVKSFDNGATLTLTYFLHHWQTLSISLFGNAIVYKNKA